MWENFEEGWKKEKKKSRNCQHLKGKLKIKEGECLSSLGRAKEVSIKERDNTRQKSIQKKYTKL